ncbi:MAG TPA: hypothetical protein VEQ18_05650 [Candidatus Nitrosocosmicus sp.]|nr:hypothetical protein [Candidatus Nitrosocosmicus sp.]
MTYDKLAESIGMEPEEWETKVAEYRILGATEKEEAFNTPTQENDFSIPEVIELCEVSLNFLAGLLLPNIFKYMYPPFYVSLWDWLKTYVHKERDFSQLALGLPRGFSKTLFIKVFICYVVLFTDRKCIFIMGETQKKSERILADTMLMLSEPNVVKVFGNWQDNNINDNLNTKNFTFRGRNIALVATIVGAARGINVNNERPDIMIFDDIQSKQMAESQLQSETLESDMVGTAMKAKSPHRCLFIFIGNMYPTKWSILRKLKRNPGWIKVIAGGLLANGESLWEELQPKEQLLKEFQNDLLAGRPETFFAEVLNDEYASSNNLIDFKALPECPYLDEPTHHGNFIIIDPSNDTVNSDAVAVGYFELFNETPVLKKVTNKTLSPGDTILTALNYALEFKVNLVLIESNAYQYSLCYWFNYICRQLGITGVEAAPIYSGNRAKNSRILDMFKALKAGELFYAPEVAPEVNLQISGFNKIKTNNTDGILDLLTYASRVLTEFADKLIYATIIEQQEMDLIEVDEFNSPI